MKNKIKKIAVVALAAMSVLVASILSCSAVTVPDYNITDDEYNYYTIIKFESGQEYVFLSYDELFVFHEGDYYYLNRNGWVRRIGITDNTDGIDKNGTLCSFTSTSAQIIAANYDVKYQNSDKVFFQQPTLLSNLLKQVPQGVGEKVAADSLILTICGIGCLALLIGLSLLPKVLYKFL